MKKYKRFEEKLDYNTLKHKDVIKSLEKVRVSVYGKGGRAKLGSLGAEQFILEPNIKCVVWDFPSKSIISVKCKEGELKGRTVNISKDDLDKFENA